MQTGSGLGILFGGDRGDKKCSSKFCENRPLFVMHDFTESGEKVYLCDECLNFIIESGQMLLKNYRKGDYDSVLFSNMSSTPVIQQTPQNINVDMTITTNGEEDDKIKDI